MAYVMDHRVTDIEALRSYVPVRERTKDASLLIEIVELSDNDKEEIESARAMLNEEILEGDSYPQDVALDEEGFRAYFLTYSAFIVHVVKDNLNRFTDNESLATFYIKPNFPGRCNHIANGGTLSLANTSLPISINLSMS